MKDMRGIDIKVGQVIAYGKSDKDHPIHIGKVISLDSKGIVVLGKGNIKTGCLPYPNRVIVLPDDYL